MTHERYAGGCLCGLIRFAADGAPLRVMNCHCKDCRKATGAVFATYVDFRRSTVIFESEPALYASSPGSERLFCAHCGSPIAYEGDTSSDEINMHIGAFDGPHRFQPIGDCHQESALWR